MPYEACRKVILHFAKFAEGVTLSGAQRGGDCMRMGFWRSPHKARGPKVQSANCVNLSGKRTEVFSGLWGKPFALSLSGACRFGVLLCFIHTAPAPAMAKKEKK